MAAKKLGCDFPPADLDAFREFADKEGYKLHRAAVAGFRLLQWAPAELRSALMSGRENEVRQWFEAAEVAMAESIVLGKRLERDPFLREVARLLASKPASVAKARGGAKKKARGIG